MNSQVNPKPQRNTVAYVFRSFNEELMVQKTFIATGKITKMDLEIKTMNFGSVCFLTISRVIISVMTVSVYVHFKI